MYLKSTGVYNKKKKKKKILVSLKRNSKLAFTVVKWTATHLWLDFFSVLEEFYSLFLAFLLHFVIFFISLRVEKWCC